MAAPMLFTSLMPLSTIFPQVTAVIFGPFPSSPRMTQPEAVAVHWAVGVRWLP